MFLFDHCMVVKCEISKINVDNNSQLLFTYPLCHPS